MSASMWRSIWSRRLLKYAAIPVGVALVLYLTWAVLRGPRSADICVAAALLLFAAFLLNLWRAEVRADREIAQQIRAEYPPESQPELFDLYDRLKAKELERLFQKVLDDAHGDLKQAKKLTALAESVGWKAFLEERW